MVQEGIVRKYKTFPITVFAFIGFSIFYLVTIGLALSDVINIHQLTNILFFYTIVYLLVLIASYNSLERENNETDARTARKDSN